MYKSIKKYIVNNIDFLLIFFWILIIPIIVLLNYNENFSISYNIGNILLILILSYIYLRKMKKNKFKFEIYDIIILILLVLNLLSTIFALNPKKALYGYSRENGFLTFFAYGLLVLNVMKIKEYKKISLLINVINVVGVINVFYSCLQLFVDMPGIYRFSKLYMASGLCLNPNFLGSFMSLLLVLNICLFVFEKINKISYIGLSLIFLMGLIFSQSTGPLVGVIISLFFFLIILIIYKKEYIKKFILTIIILCLAFFLIEKMTSNYYKYREYIVEQNYTIVGGLNDIYKLLGKYILGNASENTEESGNGRLRIWKNSIPIIKHFPLLGCGTDNFRIVYPQDRFPVIFIDAHNVYLNYACNNGIPATLIFILGLLYVLYEAIKTKENIILAFSTAYVSFCVQAFFSVSVIQVSTYFYIFTGLLIASINIYKKNKLLYNKF